MPIPFCLPAFACPLLPTPFCLSNRSTVILNRPKLDSESSIQCHKGRNRKIADVWEKDVSEFQAKSGSSGSCRLFLRFLGKIANRKTSGRTPGTPRHPSSRHPRSSEERCLFTTLHEFGHSQAVPRSPCVRFLDKRPGSRGFKRQQRSVTNHPSLSDLNCTETQ